MTKKKETILTVALRLFAGQGYENTPTSQIAKESGVSEGLIFRHFENKDGLLKALIADGQARVQTRMNLIAQERDPKEIIAQTINLPLILIEQEREFWILQFILKYRNQRAAVLKVESDYYHTLLVAVRQAFVELGYEHPDQETEMLVLLLEGLSSSLLIQAETTNAAAMVAFIKSKYNV